MRSEQIGIAVTAALDSRGEESPAGRESGGGLSPKQGTEVPSKTQKLRNGKITLNLSVSLSWTEINPDNLVLLSRK